MKMEHLCFWEWNSQAQEKKKASFLASKNFIKPFYALNKTLP